MVKHFSNKFKNYYDSKFVFISSAVSVVVELSAFSANFQLIKVVKHTLNYATTGSLYGKITALINSIMY